MVKNTKKDNASSQYSNAQTWAIWNIILNAVRYAQGKELVSKRKNPYRNALDSKWLDGFITEKRKEYEEIMKKANELKEG